MNKYIDSKKGEFDSIMEHFRKDISNLRTGRANPSMLDGVMAEAYGVKTPLNGLASLTVPDAKSMLLAPWDKSVLKNIEKAIVEANLGVGVVNEGDKIRITLPLMTEENRRELVKQLNEKMEKSRVSLRQLREEIKSEIEKAEEAKEIPEDDKFRFFRELDEVNAKRNDELKEIRDKKEKDIMTI